MVKDWTSTYVTLLLQINKNGSVTHLPSPISPIQISVGTFIKGAPLTIDQSEPGNNRSDKKKLWNEPLKDTFSTIPKIKGNQPDRKLDKQNRAIDLPTDDTSKKAMFGDDHYNHLTSLIRFIQAYLHQLERKKRVLKKDTT